MTREVPIVAKCVQALRDGGHVIADPKNYDRVVRTVLSAAVIPTKKMKLAGAPKITAQMPRNGVQADYDAANDAWEAMMRCALEGAQGGKGIGL